MKRNFTEAELPSLSYELASKRREVAGMVVLTMKQEEGPDDTDDLSTEVNTQVKEEEIETYATIVQPEANATKSFTFRDSDLSTDFERHCLGTRAPALLRSLGVINVRAYDLETSLFQIINIYANPKLGLKNTPGNIELIPYNNGINFPHINDAANYFSFKLPSNLDFSPKDFLHYFWSSYKSLFQNNKRRLIRQLQDHYFCNEITLFERVDLTQIEFYPVYLTVYGSDQADSEGYKKYHFSFNTKAYNYDNEAFNNKISLLSCVQLNPNSNENVYGVLMNEKNAKKSDWARNSDLAIARKMLMTSLVLCYLEDLNQSILIKEGQPHPLRNLKYLFSPNPIWPMVYLLFKKNLDHTTIEHLDSTSSEENYNIYYTGDSCKRNVTQTELRHALHDFVKKMVQVWKEIGSKIISNVKNKNAPKQKESLQKLFDQILLTVTKDWSADILTKPETNVTVIISTFKKMIKHHETTADEVMKSLFEESKGNSKRACAIEANFKRIDSELRLCQRYTNELARREFVFLERRKVLSDFLFRKLQHNGSSTVDISTDIEQLTSLSRYEEMFKACETYLYYSLGTDFLLTLYHYFLFKTQETSTTKIGGVFIHGEANLGKSMLLRLLFLPFKVLELTNNKNQVVTSDVPVESTERTIYKYPHIIHFDDFMLDPFKSNLNMSRQQFNNLFDWNREVKTVDIKNCALKIMTKCPIFVSSHHDFDAIAQDDNSFKSRFPVVINLNEPFKLVGCPKANPNETLDSYHQRILLTKAYAQPKYLFPISVAQAGNNFSDQERKDAQRTLQNGNEFLETQVNRCANQNNMARDERFLRDDRCKTWASFPNVSEIQASYLLHKALFRFFEKLWSTETLENKNELWPLKNTSFDHNKIKVSLEELIKNVDHMNQPERLLNMLVKETKVEVE